MSRARSFEARTKATSPLPFTCCQSPRRSSSPQTSESPAKQVPVPGSWVSRPTGQTFRSPNRRRRRARGSPMRSVPVIVGPGARYRRRMWRCAFIAHSARRVRRRASRRVRSHECVGAGARGPHHRALPEGAPRAVAGEPRSDRLGDLSRRARTPHQGRRRRVGHRRLHARARTPGAGMGGHLHLAGPVRHPRDESARPGRPRPAMPALAPRECPASDPAAGYREPRSAVPSAILGERESSRGGRVRVLPRVT